MREEPEFVRKTKTKRKKDVQQDMVVSERYMVSKNKANVYMCTIASSTTFLKPVNYNDVLNDRDDISQNQDNSTGMYLLCRQTVRQMYRHA